MQTEASDINQGIIKMGDQQTEESAHNLLNIEKRDRLYPREGNYFSRASLAEKNRGIYQAKIGGFKQVSRNIDMKHKFETIDSVAHLQSAQFMGNSKLGSNDSLMKPMRLPEINKKKA